MAYLITAIVMTLGVLENHSFIASLFNCDISYLWHVPLHLQYRTSRKSLQKNISRMAKAKDFKFCILVALGSVILGEKFQKVGYTEYPVSK